MRTLPPILDRGGLLILCRLVLNGILQATMVVGVMLLVRHAFDSLLVPGNQSPAGPITGLEGFSPAISFAAALFLCTGLAALLRTIELVDAERLGQRYIHRVRMVLFNQMSKFPPRTISKRGSGAILLRFVGDLTALRTWVSRGLARIVVAVIVVVLATGFLAYVDASLAIASLAVMLLGLAGNLLLGPKMQGAVDESRMLRGRLAQNINEKIRAFSVIQAFNQTTRERKKFRQQSLLLRRAMISRARVMGLMRIVTEGSTAISMSLLLSLGAIEAAQGMTTAGNVLSAMTMVGFLSGAFRDFGRVHEFFQNARVSEQKIVEFLQTRTMRGRAATLPDLVVRQGAIAFENASLNDGLDSITAEAPGGSRVVLCGPNGSGKSTLLQLAARLIDLTSGRILIDGQDISKCNLSSVRNAIGIATPDLPLMRGSIRYNLRYRAPDASEEEASWAGELCRLEELFATLPGREHFRLQEGGQNLSLGQRHRLSLARAILGRPPLLILDEIDANLDPQAEEVITNVFDHYPGTILMATRSTRWIEHADLCWHMEGGRLINITARPSTGRAATDTDKVR
jgi:ABC-type multidrug transport system fused ATPase/permease subunit